MYERDLSYSILGFRMYIRNYVIQFPFFEYKFGRKSVYLSVDLSYSMFFECISKVMLYSFPFSNTNSDKKVYMYRIWKRFVIHYPCCSNVYQKKNYIKSWDLNQMWRRIFSFEKVWRKNLGWYPNNSLFCYKSCKEEFFVGS